MSTEKETSNGTSVKLAVGDIFMRNGVECVVWFVNDKTARTCPLSSKIDYRCREEDGRPSFMAEGDSVNVRPDEPLEITKSLSRAGLKALIDERNIASANTPEEKTPVKKSKDKKPAKAATKAKKKDGEESKTPRLGNLGNYEGFSIGSVVRAFGKAGWKPAEVRLFMGEHKIKASEQTIALNLYRGRKGVGGDPAPLSQATLDKIRPALPDVSGKSTKPAKKKASEAPAVEAKAKKKSGKASPVLPPEYFEKQKGNKTPKAEKSGKTAKAAKQEGKDKPKASAAAQLKALKNKNVAEATSAE